MAFSCIKMPPVSGWRFPQFEAGISANHLTNFRLESKFLLRSRNELFAAKLQQKLFLMTAVGDVPHMALDVMPALSRYKPSVLFAARF